MRNLKILLPNTNFLDNSRVFFQKKKIDKLIIIYRRKPIRIIIFDFSMKFKYFIKYSIFLPFFL